MFASSSSATSESWLPGSHRSTSSAWSSSSNSSRRTAPLPRQRASAIASCSDSRSAKLTLSTAGDPSARSTLSARPTLPPLYGSPRRRPQASAQCRTISGRRSSHSRPPGTARHLSSAGGTRRFSATLGLAQARARETKPRSPATRRLSAAVRSRSRRGTASAIPVAAFPDVALRPRQRRHRGRVAAVESRQHSLDKASSLNERTPVLLRSWAEENALPRPPGSGCRR
jgi:hypothetical protein